MKRRRRRETRMEMKMIVAEDRWSNSTRKVIYNPKPDLGRHAWKTDTRSSCERRVPRDAQAPLIYFIVPGKTVVAHPDIAVRPLSSGPESASVRPAGRRHDRRWSGSSSRFPGIRTHCSRPHWLKSFVSLFLGPRLAELRSKFARMQLAKQSDPQCAVRTR